MATALRRVAAEIMIAVADVEKSSAWYQRLLGVQSAHGGPYFDQLIGADGRTVLLLHHWGGDHPTMAAVAAGVVGHGLVIYFRVGSIAPLHDAALALQADVARPPFFNELSHQHELWVRDPDGYLLTICAAAA